MPINPFPPQIEYHVPLHKLNPFADNSVFLKSIKNNGNRKLDNIIWSCQVKSSKDSSALIQFIDQINFVQEYNLLIPKLTLPSDAELKFKIQYENFIHINSYQEFTIYTHLGDLPQININVKPSYFGYETIIIGVTVGNLDLSTSKDNIKYQIQLFEIERSPIKSISSQLNISIESFSFEYFNTNISQYTLSPNSTYTFQVIATNLYTQKVQNQNFSFYVPFAGLICQFNNQGIQSIRQDLNLQIYCRDLDTNYEWNNDLDLYIEVDCKDLTLNRTCQNEQKQTIKVNKTNTFQFIRKNTISSFTVQEWTVNVTKFHQTSKFTQIIVYLDNDFPVLDLEFNQGYLIRKINNYEQLNFTFLIPLYQKAQLLDLSIAIIYNYQVIQILQPKYISHQFKIFNTIKELNFGDDVNLKFAAQYTNNIMPSVNNIKISINQPPQCSKIFLALSSDLALTDINVTTICQQSNDYPYRYQLRLFLRESDLIWFLQGQSDYSLIYYPFQNQNYFSFKISTSVDSSAVGILIQVLDGGGSISNVFEKITQKSANINCTSIQYQNYTLQNKISLLFEAMNQNCDQLHRRIYHDLLYQSILPDSNDNNLKFQAIKLYNKFLNKSASFKPKNRLLNEESLQMCYDPYTTYFYVTNPPTEIQINLTQKIEDLKQKTLKLDEALKYLSKIKKQSEEELYRNQFIWNEEIFQQYENSQEGLINLLYFLDDIYSDFSTVDIKNETIYQMIVGLLKYIPMIIEITQNTILVNDKPIVIQGDEILQQIKRRTKQVFNSQFNIEATKEDYLIDFIQYESTYLLSNPLRFSADLDNLLQKELNDESLKIYSKYYYQIKLKNVYKNRFIYFEDLPSKYRTKFGNYQICANDTQILKVYEMQCVMRTISGKFHKCNLNRILNNETMEQSCECNKFGDIFLTTSTNISKIIVNNTQQQELETDNFFLLEQFLVLVICTGSLTLLQFTIYIFYLIKDCRIEEKMITQQSNLSPSIHKNKRSLIYKGNSLIFKEKFKVIHQTVSLFYYSDQDIKLSYRILELLSQFNLLLSLSILECYNSINQILFICLFIIANPIVILILRIFYKIIEAIYRFRGIAAFIRINLLIKAAIPLNLQIASIILQNILIILFMMPNLVLLIFYIFKIQIQQEQYQVAIIVLGNSFISQILIEPLTIFARIIVYRMIASSIKNMDMNPIYHLMHFFVMHNSLEEIFEEFTRIRQSFFIQITIKFNFNFILIIFIRVSFQIV